MVSLDAPFHQHLSICTSLHCPPLPPRFEDWGTFSPFRGFGGRRRKLRLAIQEFRKLTASQSKYLYCQRKRGEQNVEYGHIKGGARVNVYLFEAGKGDRLTRVLLPWTDLPTQHLRCKLKSYNRRALHYITSHMLCIKHPSYSSYQVEHIHPTLLFEGT